MAKFDIFNPTVSKVVKGIEGKVITLMGNNSTGKTLQATRFPKPFYLGFEQGLNAISGVPYATIENWSDFMQVNRQLTAKRNRDKIKETYQTIIFDEVYTASLYCQQHVCDANGVNTISEGNGGFGLWKEYETAFWKEIDKLLKIGMTIVFIIHTEQNKDGQYVPKGDKRSVDPVIDNSDVVAFLKPNGVDDKGRPVKSSAIFVETPAAFARTRFEHMTPYIQEFTADNLTKAIEDAIAKEEEVSGITGQTLEEKHEEEKNKKSALSYDEVLEQIKATGIALGKAGFGQQANDIVRENLGVKKDADGKPTNEAVKPSEVHKEDVDKLYILLLDMQEYAEEKEVQLA